MLLSSSLNKSGPSGQQQEMKGNGGFQKLEMIGGDDTNNSGS